MGGPGRTAQFPGTRIVPARYARLIGGAPANDNPLPPGVRLRRAVLLTLMAFAGVLLAAALSAA